MAERFTTTCNACGAPAEVELNEGGGCSDSDCCGGPTYSIIYRCTRCPITETSYD